MSSSKTRKARVVERAERFFSQSVVALDAPGGDGRSSYRLIFSDRTVIATLRPNFRRTHIEAYTLKSLRPYCDDIPNCLGVDGEILFQSDVGGRRLNLEITKVGKSRRADLAHEAVASIFRIQAAGRKAGLHENLPHLGQNRLWLENFIGAADILAEFSDGATVALDKPALCEMLAFPGRQFVKWDCRAGNAALGPDDRLRWFDFEYSGARHGAEDIAWLIGDEAWPLQPDVMESIVTECFDPATGDRLDEYLDYLALYLSFHCAQRFKLILSEANSRGWLSKTRVRSHDDVGVHPEFAAHICRVGHHFAERNRATRPLARDFEKAQRAFLQILQDSQKSEIA